MGRLPAHQKRRILERVLKNNFSVSSVCRQNGISRKTFYTWKKKYLSAGPRNKLSCLEKRHLRGLEHPRGTKLRFKKEALRLVTLHPEWGSHTISQKLKVKGQKLGNHGVYTLLKELNLETYPKRRVFASDYRGPLRLVPEARKRMVERVILAQEEVEKTAEEFLVSRKTIWKWAKRYKKAQEEKIELLLALRDQNPTGSAHPRGTPEWLEKKILAQVISHPEYSTHNLAAIIPEIGNHGIQNVLLRNSLNTFDKRLEYARLHVPVSLVQPITGWWERLKTVFETFVPAIAPAPPPKLIEIAKAFLASFASSSVLSLAFLLWLQMLSGQPVSTKLGFFFATIALSMGTFFFLYSMKYYFTLAVVLSFSRQAGEEGVGVGLSGEVSKDKNHGWLARIFGLNGSLRGPTSREVGPLQVAAGGLQPSLDHIKLKRYPFVSIHLPFYNEKKVANRILSACTSFDYPDYEVIVIDDSTDETTELIREYQGKLGKIKEYQGKDGTTISKTPAIPNTPSLTVIHRSSRSGFKGGALGEALKHMDPRTEFVVVFDADFIPYPDTLELFMKYFQVNGLDLAKERFTSEVSRRRNTTSEVEGNKIAAVAGYQWHVLNKSENWITRGVRTEYAGSYVIERPGQEILGAMKLIHGSVYAIRADILRKFGWGTSITEDFELTLRLYAQGYKVVYTPYVQAPAECVSTLKRLIRQRMRWSEGHSYCVKRRFTQIMTSPLMTLTEKLEFLYLSPYYLQAAFFLVGTFSWLLAETVFRARLPFWTSLWGWSLVLTNFFSLPLVNAVGLFLEEAEEKDYLGIMSFIFLSYLLVPFQAYASVKGFLEKEEGPWFRTPKTGLITDIFTRGRFYRWISGIIPGRAKPSLAPIAAEISADQRRFFNQPLSAYVALATANNRFENFRISKKQARWIGRTFLVMLLIFSIILLSVAPAAPYFIKPKEAQAQSRAFGMVGGPSSREPLQGLAHEQTQPDQANPKGNKIKLALNSFQNLAKRAVSPRKQTMLASGAIIAPEKAKNEVRREVLTKLGITIGKQMRSLLNWIQQSYSKAKSKFLLTKNRIEKRTQSKEKKRVFIEEGLPRKDFRSNQNPELTFDFNQKGITHRLLKVFKANQPSLSGEVKASLLDPEGKGVGIELEIVKEGEGDVKVKVPSLAAFKPGAYKLKVELGRDGEILTQEQEFTWGVLAINFNKSVYTPGEQVYIQMAVLREDGHTICDAKLRLQILNPKSEILNLSTEDGSIQYSGKCGPDNVTDVPDYFAYYQVGDLGNYEMKLTNLDNGHQITDSFEARESVPFEIERIGPTRIYPPAVYEMRLRIRPNENFKGEVVETVPESFNIKNQISNIKYTEQKSKSGEKELVWEVDWKAGESQELVYQFDAPDESPMFYLLGPLRLRSGQAFIFEEARRWQIAADADTGWKTTTSTAAVTSNAGDNNGFQGTSGNSPTDSTTSNDGYMTDTDTGTGTATDGCATFPQAEDDQHDFYNFGFSFLTGTTINGIEAQVEANTDSASGTNLICVALSWNSGTNWTAAKGSTDFGTSDATETHGGAADTWGRAWGVSDFTNANFRVRLMPDPSQSNARDYSLDLFQIKAYYTSPPNITVATTGTQVSRVPLPGTDKYIGGAFTFVRDSGSTNVTQIKITETGSVNASLYLSNVEIRYETAATCVYDGGETLFGTGTSFTDGTGAEKTTVSGGTMAVGTSQVCVYVILDIGSGATKGQTIEIEISNPSTEVTVDAGTVSPATAVVIAGTTTIGALPNDPTSLAQKKTDDTPISTGDWIGETSIKFTASASDPDASDTLQLCVEKDLVGTAFSNTEDSCGTGVAYSGTAVTVTVTISGLTAGQYHWQARIKDAAGLYSSWVSYPDFVNVFTEEFTGANGSNPDADWVESTGGSCSGTSDYTIQSNRLQGVFGTTATNCSLTLRTASQQANFTSQVVEVRFDADPFSDATRTLYFFAVPTATNGDISAASDWIGVKFSGGSIALKKKVGGSESAIGSSFDDRATAFGQRLDSFKLRIDPTNATLYRWEQEGWTQKASGAHGQTTLNQYLAFQNYTTNASDATRLHDNVIVDGKNSEDQRDFGVGINYSGTAYEDETEDALVACDNDPNTKEIAIRTATYAETYSASCDDTTGVWTTLGGPPATSAAIITWINDVSNNYGANVNRYSGTGGVTSIAVRRNRLIVQHDDAGSTTNTNMDSYDNGQDTDINYVVTDGALTVEAGSKLIINTDDTFAPGGTVTIEANTNGDLLVNSGATLSGANNVTVNGGDATGDGTITLTAGTFTLEGAGSFGGATDWTFNDLTFGGDANVETTSAAGSGAITVSGVLTIGANQTLNAGSKTWTLAGAGTPLVKTGTFNAETSTFKYTSPGEGGAAPQYIKKLEQQINIIDQEYSTNSTSASPTDNSLGIIKFDPDKYNGETVYFEVVGKRDTQAYTRTRTSAVTMPTSAKEFTVRIYRRYLDPDYDCAAVLRNITDSSNTVSLYYYAATSTSTCYIKSARLIVVQSDAIAITATETQVEVGNNESTVSTSYLRLANYKIYRWDDDRFSGTTSVYFEATIKSNVETGWIEATLSLSSTCASYVTLVANDTTSWELARSTNIASNLTDDTDYWVCIKRTAPATTGYIANAKIIIDQTDSSGLTKTQIVHQYNNTLATDADATYTAQDFDNQFDASKFGGTDFSAYFESTLKTSNAAGAYYARLAAGATVIANTEVTGTDISYVRKRGTNIWNDLPATATDIDVELKNASTYTTSSSTSWLIIQAGDQKGPTNIDNASDFGGMPGAGRQVVRTSKGTLYAVIRDDFDLEVWKSFDGSSWEEKDSANSPAHIGFSAVAADSNDDLHIAYLNTTLPSDVMYVKFTTSTDSFGTPETVRDVIDPALAYLLDIAVDSSNAPHVAWGGKASASDYKIYYRNKTGGTWQTTVAVESITTDRLNHPSITINEDNIPEISYINSVDDNLTAAVGNANNATSFGTPYDVDTLVNDVANQRETSIAVDQNGNTWIAYIDSDNYTTLAKHNDSDPWTTWTIDISNSANNVGYEPSIAINGSDIYVFYQEDSTDQKIVYDRYDGSTWLGETVLHTPPSTVDYQDVKAKWTFEWNNFGPNRIDYLFSDGTDVYWSYLNLRRMPVNVKDPNNFGAMPAAGRQIVRDSNGNLFAVFVDDPNNDLEVWKSTDGGNSWSEQDSANSPEILGDLAAVAVDSTNKLHIAYQYHVDGSVAVYIRYVNFNGTFGALTDIMAYSGDPAYGDSLDIAVDSNNVPHVISSGHYLSGGVANLYYVKYRNQTGGSWQLVVAIEGGTDTAAFYSTSININEDNIPEISYVYSYDDDLTAGVGADNNPASGEWTLYDVDTTVNDVADQRGTSIAVDSAGNTWIAYVDEMSWTERTNPKSVILFSVTYGEGLFVAVGDPDGTDAYILTSPDGTTWTERTNPKNYSLRGVTYGEGLFVAVGLLDGTDAYILTSPDGTTWTERSNPKDKYLYGVTYGEGLFVAVGNPDGTDAYLVTSPDGTTWTERSNPKNYGLNGVTYGEGLFVAVGTGDGTDAYLVTSPDGTTWTEQSNPKNVTLQGVTYGEGLFVAVGWADGTDAYLVTSPDGTTWTERSNPKNVTLQGVTYGEGLFVAVGTGDGTDAYLVTSPDGTTWTERSNPKNVTLRGVTYGEGLFVAVGSADGTDAYLLTSLGDDLTTLVKHNDTDAWSTWQTPVTNGNVGYEPSIAVDGTDTYVFYEDDQDDIVYDKYDGSSWDGEKILEMHSALQDVKARWTSSYTTYGIDYLYSDNTDVFYNRLEFGGAGGTVNITVAIYNNLELSPSVAGGPTYTLGTGTIQTTGYLKNGDGAYAVTVTAATNNTILNIDSYFTISAEAVFTASTTAAFNIAGNFTNNGTFTANSGTVIFDDANKTSQLTYSANTTFYDFNVSTAGKTMEFDQADQTIITHSLTFQGIDCTAGRVFLHSVEEGNQWDINFTGNIENTTIEYVDLWYSNAIVGLTAENSTKDDNNNTGWTINAGVCAGATSEFLTAWSFQRKTFWDANEDVYWRFSYSGSDIDIEYNSSPWDSSWTAISSIEKSTNDFSVWDDDTYVYLAYYDTYDIKVKKGTLGSASISWDNNTEGACASGECLALDGSVSTPYNYVQVSKDTTGRIWVVARYYTGTNYYMRAVRSTSADNLTGWGTVNDVSLTSNTIDNVYGVVVPLNTTDDMYLVFNRAGTYVEGCRWDSDQAGGARWENYLDQTCDDGANVDAVGTGITGLANTLSATTDSEKDVHVIWADGSNYIQHNKYDESASSWGGANRVDNGGAVANAYPTVSFDSDSETNEVYALYIRNNVIYYNKWGEDATPTTTNETTPGSWTPGTTPAYLTSNYADSGRIFAEWTSGSVSPYTLNWNYIIIPERIWMLLALGLVIPGLLRKKRRK